MDTVKCLTADRSTEGPHHQSSEAPVTVRWIRRPAKDTYIPENI